VGLRAGLDAVAKRKIPSPRRESNVDRPDRPTCSLDAEKKEIKKGEGSKGTRKREKEKRSTDSYVILQPCFVW
jgi:hypothetical protein